MVWDFDTEWIVNLVLYIIIVLAFIVILKVELSDLKCYNHAGEWCGLRIGRDWIRYPDEDSNEDELLDYIEVAVRHHINGIHWRRSLLAAIIISFLILYVNQRRIPWAVEWIAGIVIAFLIIYLVTLLFQQQIVVPAIKRSDKAVHILRRIYQEY